MANWYEKLKESIRLRIKWPKDDLANYSLAKLFRERGFNITHEALKGYEENRENKTIRTLVYARSMSGKSWNDVGKWLDEEFLK